MQHDLISDLVSVNNISHTHLAYLPPCTCSAAALVLELGNHTDLPQAPWSPQSSQREGAHQATIHEAERARNGAVCIREELLETRRRWMRSHSPNPSHEIEFVGKHRRPRVVDPAGLEVGGVIVS